MANAVVDPDRAPMKLYAGLKLPSEGSIRLLDIAPGQQKTPIEVSLRVVSLDSRPQYEALSYTWGSSSQCNTILVNEIYSTPVTDNLFRALKRLRHETESRTLWVDALCINQQDTDERSQQVAIMGSIYRSAKCVDVWLGEPSFVFPFSLDIRNYVDGPLFQGVVENLRGPARAPMSLHGFRSLVKNHVNAIISAIENTVPPWHERAWTIQEFSLAREVRLCFGRHNIQYDSGWFGTMAFSGHLNKQMDFYRKICNLDQLRTASKSAPVQEPPSSPVDILHVATRVMAGARATDARDMIYSVLGLIDGREADMIGSDYTSKCTVVFAKATFASMVVRRDFDILCLVRLTGCGRDGIPSWAVNFANLEASDVDAMRRSERRGIVLDDDLQIQVALDASAQALTLSGARFDTIADCVSLRGISNTRGPQGSRSNVMQQVGALIADSILSVAHVLSKPVLPETARHGSNNLRRRLNKHAELAFVREAGTYSNKIRAKYSTEKFMSLPTLFWAFQQWSRAIEGRRITWRQFHGWVSDEMYDIEEVFNAVTTLAIAAAGEASVFATSTGLIGLAPATVAAGDVIVLVRNRLQFLLLRPCNSLGRQTYHFGGLVYVHDFMTLENDFSQEEFVLE